MGSSLKGPLPAADLEALVGHSTRVYPHPPKWEAQGPLEYRLFRSTSLYGYLYVERQTYGDFEFLLQPDKAPRTEVFRGKLCLEGIELSTATDISVMDQLTAFAVDHVNSPGRLSLHASTEFVQVMMDFPKHKRTGSRLLSRLRVSFVHWRGNT